MKDFLRLDIKNLVDTVFLQSKAGKSSALQEKFF